MFTPVTRVPTAPTHQQPISEGVACPARECAESVTFPPSRHAARPMSRKRDEPVRLTKIYTRGGDRGETSLGDGSRASKLDPRIAAYGAVDELNSQLGVVLALAELPAEQREPLERVQNDLFDVGADLSVPFGGGEERLRVSQEQIDGLERLCDRFNEALPGAEELRAPRRNRGCSAAARRPNGLPPRRIACPRHRGRGGDRSARAGLPEPALGSAVHPRPQRKRRRPRSRSGSRAAQPATP